jgi:DNA-binding NarL/FixJ family response regulator
MQSSAVEVLRILLIDDHVVVRSGMRLLIESQIGLEIAGEAGTGAEGLLLAASLRPDIILLDLELTDENSLATLSRLVADEPCIPVLVLTSNRDVDVHSQAIRLGARGLVQKAASTDTFFKAIRKVCAGELWFDRNLLGRAVSDLTRVREGGSLDSELQRIESLTKREFEVALLAGEGLRNRSIGERLFISETTVRHHLTSIYDKLGVSDRFELIVLAHRRGLVNRVN